MVNQKYVVTCDVCGKEDVYYINPAGVTHKLRLSIKKDPWSSEEKQKEEIEIDICKECIKKCFGELVEKALKKVDKCYEQNKGLYKEVISLEIK